MTEFSIRTRQMTSEEVGHVRENIRATVSQCFWWTVITLALLLKVKSLVNKLGGLPLIGNILVVLAVIVMPAGVVYLGRRWVLLKRALAKDMVEEMRFVLPDDTNIRLENITIMLGQSTLENDNKAIAYITKLAMEAQAGSKLLVTALPGPNCVLTTEMHPPAGQSA